MSLVPVDLPPLWARLATFGATETDAALGHLLRCLADRVDARTGYWLGAVRMQDASFADPLNGWRPVAIRYLSPLPGEEQVFKKFVAEIERGEPDASTIAHTGQAGRFRAVLLRDLMPPTWFSSPYYLETYRALGIVDTVWVICPVSVDAEAYYAWHRMEGQAPFAPEDRDWLAAALLGTPAFHHTVMLSYGLQLADRPLTPTERRVMALLLSDRTEKAIASSLGLSARTTHHHVTAIFRKFGVRGRPGLLALWLGGAGRSSTTPAD